MRPTIGESLTFEREVFMAMHKYALDMPLTAMEWDALAWLTLIDKKRLVFSPDNCRWAETDAEHAKNLKFYQRRGKKTPR